MESQLLFTHDSAHEVEQLLSQETFDKVFLLCDQHTQELCRPLWEKSALEAALASIVIPAGEAHKNIETLSRIWEALGNGGATRHSLLINMGGGVVTDMGGFAAATFKRGIACWNVPTTLLAMVDASVGGKTGIDFGGLKNEIGAFHTPGAVIFDTRFLTTLDPENLLSGYAEMLKHGLLQSTAEWARLLRFDLDHIDYKAMQELIATSIDIKRKVVEEDPFEKEARKMLNLGHTFGHALESHALESGRPILHGYAVAYGLVCELYLSCIKLGFPTDKFRQTAQFIGTHYGHLPIDCKQYERICALMQHDKKNVAGEIRCALLKNIGEVALDQVVEQKEIEEVLDFYATC